MIRISGLISEPATGGRVQLRVFDDFDEMALLHGCGVCSRHARDACAERSTRRPATEAVPDELSKSYGEDVTKRAFSDELTEKRKTLIKDTLTREQKCSAEPKFVLRDVHPYQVAPTDVAWVERYEVACLGTVYRAALMILDDGKIEAMPLLAGATIADPSLQVDAATIVTAAALTREAKECNQATITDTELTDKPQAGRPWKERWSVNTCGDVQKVDVVFTPSAQGGTDISVTQP